MADYKTAEEIAKAVAWYIDYRRNVIIGNVINQRANCEMDMAILTKSGYMKEVEIKISRADLLRDKGKWKWRNWYNKVNGLYCDYLTYSNLRQMWFAIPSILIDSIDDIPEMCGVLVVDSKGDVTTERPAKINKDAKKLSIQSQLEFARLASLRLW